METEDIRRDLLKDEYKHLIEAMRAYANMRYSKLTAYTAFNGGLLAVLSNKEFTLLIGIIAGFGVAITLLFIGMEFRQAEYFESFHKRAKVIEAALGYKIWLERPEKGCLSISVSKGVAYLYFLIGIGWFIFLISIFLQRY